MTPEELLMPRYKVIADYVHSPYTIGMLVENTVSEIMRHRENVSWLLTQTSCYDGFTGDEKVNNYFPEQRLIELPHLFKMLEWWEDRDENDLPKYLRFKDNIWKVDKWVVDMIKQVYPTYKNDEGNDFLCIKWNFFKNEFSPATEDEYLNQNK